jgi:integrase
MPQRIDPRTAKPLPTGVYLSGREHYQYRIKHQGRPEVRGGFLSADDAFVARHQRLVQLGQASPDALPDNRTLEQWFAHWIQQWRIVSGARDSTVFEYQNTARRYILSQLGTYRLRDLTPQIVRQWVATLTRDVSPSRAKEARRLLRQMLQQAVEDEIIPRNVAAIVRPPRTETRETAHLTPDEIVAFLAVADNDEHCALWYLGMLVQLRPGELAGLRWDDIDLDARTVRISATRTRSAAGRWSLGDDTKRPASRRTIDLPTICVEKLREHRRRQAAVRLQMPPGSWKELGLVFPNRTGGVMSGSTMQYRIRSICREAGVTIITPAGLRHSGATWARRLGEDIEVVQRRLGHTKIETTLNRYRHVAPEEQRELSARLDAALRGLRTSS